MSERIQIGDEWTSECGRYVVEVIACDEDPYSHYADVRVIKGDATHTPGGFLHNQFFPYFRLIGGRVPFELTYREGDSTINQWLIIHARSDKHV